MYLLDTMMPLTKDAMLIAPRQSLIDMINFQAEKIDALKNKITEMAVYMEWLKKQVFGPKSEHIKPAAADDLQIAIDMGIVDKNETDDTQTKTITYTKSINKKKNPEKPFVGHGRGNMPTHLPIKDITIQPQGDISGMVHLHDEISWYYEMDKPASLHIVRTIRPVYAKPQPKEIVVAPLPDQPVEKGNAGPGLMTRIILDKFLYHNPLDRQRRKFQNEYDVYFAESWLADIVKNSTFWLNTMAVQYRLKICSSSYLQADETPIPVLIKGGWGKTHRGYYWVYFDPIDKVIIFDYRENRSRLGPSDFLKDFHGTLQVDGYEGYNEIITQNSLIRAGCMDHVRRRFEKALSYDPQRATYALDTMREWYLLERQSRENNLSAHEKMVLRKEKIAPSMATFETWMQEQACQVLPKSPLGVAFSYALNQWGFFKAFLNDPRIELSNILIENALRPVALGRKNYLFAGSHDAARRNAIIYSLIATAQMHGVDPFIYLKNLLTELPRSKTSDISKFMLPTWKTPQSS